MAHFMAKNMTEYPISN